MLHPGLTRQVALTGAAACHSISGFKACNAAWQNIHQRSVAPAQTIRKKKRCTYKECVTIPAVPCSVLKKRMRQNDYSSDSC